MNLLFRAGDKGSSYKLQGMGWAITKRQEKSGWTSVRNDVACCRCNSGVCVVSQRFCLLLYWNESVSTFGSLTHKVMSKCIPQIKRWLLGSTEKSQFLSLDQLSWSAFSARISYFKEFTLPKFIYRKYKSDIFHILLSPLMVKGKVIFTLSNSIEK